MTFPNDALMGGKEVQSAAWGPSDSVVRIEIQFIKTVYVSALVTLMRKSFRLN